LLLQPLGAPPFEMLFDILHLGYMANNLLPLKAGEFFRASFVSKKFKIPYAQVLTTVGLERYFAGFSLILILLVVAGTLHLPVWIKTGAYVMGAVLLGVQLVLIVIWKKALRLEDWEHRHPFIYHIVEFLFHIGEGSQPLRSFKSFISLNGLALLTWLTQAAMLKIIERAFHVPLGIFPSLFVLIAINLAIALPSAPGNLGTFELAAVLAYSFLGVEKPIALGIGFYFHFLQVIPVTLVGLFYYVRWGIRLKDVEQAVEEKAEAIEEMVSGE
jgi:glycosyltransferase 2 family protein